MNDITKILKQIDTGPCTSEDLLPLVYDQLRSLAERELSKEPSGLTLQPTALVHEAYVRLVDQETEPEWNHRGHFFSAAARAMRRIIVENARRKKALKRGGDHARLPLENAIDVSQLRNNPDLVALDEALSELELHDADVAQLVSLRYFAGLTMSEAASALGISLRTAQRQWAYAKAWLWESIRKDA